MSDSKFTCRTPSKALIWLGPLALSLVASFATQSNATPLGPGDSQCVVDPANVVTCSGDLSAGVYIDSEDYDTSNLSDVDAHDGEGEDPVHIRPETGNAGIYFNNQTEDAHIQVIGDSQGINMEVDEPLEGAAIVIKAKTQSGKVSFNFWPQRRDSASASSIILKCSAGLAQRACAAGLS